MRVHVVDPPAYTPPYDHALSAALARAGAEVTLVTGRFDYAEVPRGHGYAVDERFYSRGPAGGGGRRLARALQHVPDMLGYRRAARTADVVHFQWLAVQEADLHLLPRGRPLVLTAHDVLPREAGARRREAQRRLYERMDHVVVHTAHGRERLVAEAGVDPARITVIPHGAFTHLLDVPDRAPLPAELAAVERERPVVLFFGLLRPYKGLDVLLEAWRGIEDAELWVVGMPRMDVAPLRAAAPPGVRFVERFVPDREIPAYFERADLVVLPYLEIDQSGVLFTALAFGRPLLLSAVGGFPELASEGAARLVPPGDPAALHDELAALLADPEARAALGARAAHAARERYGWDPIARAHLDLYARLAGDGA